VSELWEVNGMIQSCVGVEDCELLEDVGVNGTEWNRWEMMFS
jgi:hypothetical protein